MPKNLSDYGISTNAMSSSLGPVQMPSVQELVATGQGSAKRAAELGRQIEAMQGQEDQGILSKLLSSGGLETLLMAAGGAATGGALPAAMFGLTGLNDLLGSPGEEDMERDEMIGALKKEQDSEYDRFEKAQQRMTTAYQTDPSAFMDAEGNLTVTPKELGAAMTGFPIEIDPSTRHKMQRVSESRANAIELIVYTLENSRDVEKRKMLLNHLFELSDGYEAPEELVNVIASTTDPQKLDATLVGAAERAFENFPHVMGIALNSERGMYDPNVWIQGVKKKALPDGMEISDLTVKGLLAMNTYVKENPQEVLKIREENPTEPDFTRALATAALGTDQGTAKATIKYLGAHITDTGSFFREMGKARGEDALTASILEARGLSEALNKSPEERELDLVKTTVSRLESRKKEAKEAIVAQRVERLKIIRDKLNKYGMGNRDKEMYAFILLEPGVISPNGEIDAAEFDKQVMIYTNALIQQQIGE